MIGVASATSSLVEWGLVITGVVLVCCIIGAIVHNHVLHRRLMDELKRQTVQF